MAGARDVTRYGVKMLEDEPRFVAQLKWPVLLWEAAPTNPEAPLMFATRAGERLTKPTASSAVFFEVKKSAKNAFAEEITVGRTGNNDIVIEDNSVSRFHAYFGLTEKGWTVVDAKSSVGTYLGGKRLVQRGRTAVADKVTVRFGHVELVFLMPDSFVAHLKKLSRSR
jgi:pSer/pThr/pTyr-binding forkhead associated (FHA) protein